MTQLEKMRQWLLTWPGWNAGGLLHIDFTDGVPGSTGLFPTGVEELGRFEDLLGNVTVKNRYNFALYRVAGSHEDDAQWLLALQQWIQEQSLLQLAPTFGDEPSSERIRAQGGKRSRDRLTGIYTVALSVDFTRYYPGARAI